MAAEPLRDGIELLSNHRHLFRSPQGASEIRISLNHQTGKPDAVKKRTNECREMNLEVRRETLEHFLLSFYSRLRVNEGIISTCLGD
jgi:hypothetical protein